MKFITVGDLRGRAGEVWSKLARDKDLVLTSSGKPIAILSAVSEETLEGSLAALGQTRAVTAVEAMQSKAVGAGTDKMALAEINAEISSTRKARRR